MMRGAVLGSVAMAVMATVSATDMADEQNIVGLDSELRLIELSPGERVHMSFDDILRLKQAGRNFMDVTDHPEVRVAVADKEEPKLPAKVQFKEEVAELSLNLSRQNLVDSLTEFSSFYNRYAKSQNGLESSMWLYNEVNAASKGRLDINVTLWDHEWPQKSVIARFEGTKRPDDVVIIGAHQDSINLLMPTLLPAPGADDDGSGSMTILEVFRVLAEAGWQPENTVEFQWYSAEELGLLGSQDIATAYANAGINVKAMLEQDMTGYSAGSTKDGHPDEMGVFRDNADPALTSFVKVLIDSYCQIGWVETECGYGCSDYVSWTKIAGAPASFVSESDFSKFNPYIHTTEDKVDKLDFDHMLQHARFTLGFAVELGYNEF